MECEIIFGGLPGSFSPRSRALVDYYGVTLPESSCFQAERLAAKLAKLDPDLGLDFMRGHLAQFFQLAMSHEPKVQVVALKVLSEIAGLGNGKNKTELSVSIKLGDLINEATSRMKLVSRGA